MGDLTLSASRGRESREQVRVASSRRGGQRTMDVQILRAKKGLSEEKLKMKI